MTKSTQYDDDQMLLKKKVLQNYWEASGNIDFIKDLFEREIIRSDMDTLISGRSIQFMLRESITSEDFLILKKISQLPSNYEITQHAVNIVFSYLMMGGYLTFANKYEESFVLPNHEIRHELQNKVLEYYSAKYGVSTRYFTSVINALSDVLSYVNDDRYNASISVFADSFSTLLMRLPSFRNITDDNISESVRDSTIHGNEDLVHCLLSYIALQLHCTRKKFGSELCLGEGRADIALINRDLGVGSIIEIKYTKDDSKCEQMALEGLEQIENKKYAEEMKKYYDVVLLGIAVSEDKAVVIKDKVLKLECSVEVEKRSRLLDFNLT